MKSVAICCVLLGLVGSSYQAASHCYDLGRFQGKLMDCLGIVMAADLNDIDTASINAYCSEIQRGASCMDNAVEACRDAFPADAFRAMKKETNSLMSDYNDMCTQLRQMTASSYKRSEHSTRSTVALNKLLTLHPFK